MPSSQAVEDASDESPGLCDSQHGLTCGLLDHSESSLRGSILVAANSLPQWPSESSSVNRLLRDHRCKWAAAAFTLLIIIAGAFRRGAAVPRSRSSSDISKTLISYSYFEKDPIQRENFEFFIRHGQPEASESFFHTIYTVSGQVCNPCTQLTKKMGLVPSQPATFPMGTVTASLVSSTVTLLRRAENVGRDFGNHNVSLAWIQRNDPSALKGFKYFVFINSSVKGPFMPNYFSSAWHWSQAFTSLLNGRVKAVGPSLVCLPEADDATGPPAPRLESYLFATDHEGLSTVREAGVLDIWESGEQVALNSDNGLTASLFRAGFDVATLLYKYGEGIDWRDSSNWACNDQVHPNRGCSYGDISQHPFETVFVRTSWGLDSVALHKYSQWMDDKMMKRATHGSLDLARYLAAVKHEPMCHMGASAGASPKPQAGPAQKKAAPAGKRHEEPLIRRPEIPFTAPEGPERPGEDPMNPLDLWTGPILGRGEVWEGTNTRHKQHMMMQRHRHRVAGQPHHRPRSQRPPHG